MALSNAWLWVSASAPISFWLVTPISSVRSLQQHIMQPEQIVDLRFCGWAGVPVHYSNPCLVI